MSIVIKYTYDSWTETCGCCSDSTSTIDVWVDGELVLEDVYFGLMEDEDELRMSIRELYDEYEGFIVHPDTKYF